MTAMSSATPRFARSADIVDVLERETPDGGQEMLVARRDLMLRLTGVGVAIWGATAEPASADAVVIDVAAAFEMPAAEVAEAIGVALDELLRMGVLQLV